MQDVRMETFLTVCDTMNFTKAAEILCITQPAVSQHIKYLEQVYETSLFQYSGKKLRLTKAGEMVRQMAAAERNDEALLRERLKGISNAITPMKFGVTMTIGESVIAKPLIQYMKSHQNVHVNMQMGNTTELLGKLKEGTINCAIVEGYYDETELDSEIFSEARFIPVCAKKHKFTKEVKVLKDLFGETLLLREEGSGTREILTKQLSLHNTGLHAFSRVQEVGCIPTILQMVAADIGITFLYEPAAREEIEKGNLREIVLKDFKVTHPFAFIWEKASVYEDDYRNICRDLRDGL